MRKAVSTSKVLLLTYILLRVQPGVFKMLMLLGLWRTDSFRLPYLLGEKRKGKRRSRWVLMEQQQQRIHPQRCQILSCCKPRGSDIGARSVEQSCSPHAPGAVRASPTRTN